LNPAGGVHSGGLKFFRAHHRVKQICEQSEGDQPDDEVLHSDPSESFAEAHVGAAGEEERHNNADEDHIVHQGNVVDWVSGR
jgi:hypothetical protein